MTITLSDTVATALLVIGVVGISIGIGTIIFLARMLATGSYRQYANMVEKHDERMGRIRESIKENRERHHD